MSSDVPPPEQKGSAETARPSFAQRRYLERGLTQPGGKLPLFDTDGRQVARQTVESCIARGWAVTWFANPTKPDWLVCRLTPAGYRALGHDAPLLPPDSPADR